MLLGPIYLVAGLILWLGTYRLNPNAPWLYHPSCVGSHLCAVPTRLHARVVPARRPTASTPLSC